ncbi:MAG: GTPase Era [Candidatus Kapaibacterium sp.]
MSTTSITRCGAIAIIGKPNTGKSTLMNAILGAKLSIVSPKPQTTRKNVLGIYTEEDVQILFLDTPGVLTPRYELHKSMMEYVKNSIAESDDVMVLIDAVNARKSSEFLTPEFTTMLQSSGLPVFCVFNKVDALKNRRDVLPLIIQYQQLGLFKEFFTISALENKYVEDMLKTIAGYMPEGVFLHDAEDLSTLPQRFFISEIIREVIFHEFEQEIPYSAEVLIQEFKEREIGKWYIAADIIVERDTQKAILIGKKGEKIKAVGQKARIAAEEHLGTAVFLEIFVKVRNDWRNSKTQLSGFGY